MMRLIARGCAGAVGGALVGAASLFVAYARDPRVALNANLTALVRGIYPTELAGNEPFSWAGPEASFILPGLDRRLPWACTVRLRGARADPTTLPDVVATVNGTRAARFQTTNDYQDLHVVVPPDPGASRTILGLSASTSFVPGKGDSRTLAVQLAGWTCTPQGVPRPPARAVLALGVAVGVFGALFGLMGAGTPALIGATLLLGALQAAVVTKGLGVFLTYVWNLVPLALWIGVAAGVVALVSVARARAALPATARFVIGFSASAAYLKMAALLHPAKPLVDALFHAHRLEWVMGGRFYFTQPLSSGVEFPYAIGLYLVAVPLTALTRDYVALLNVIVAAAEVVAGALLYVMVVRAWGDRLVGAMAVALFALVPIADQVLGHANLTNAFGQSVALFALAAATVWRLAWRAIGTLLALVALVTLAFLCHVSTFALLFATLLPLAAFYRWTGDRALRTPAGIVLVATVIALTIATVTYYAHFTDAYVSVLHARAAHSAPAVGGSTDAADHPAARPSAGAEAAASASLSSRAIGDVGLAISAVGWPIALLAMAGVWDTWRARGRDRLIWVIAAWGLAFVVFMAVGIAAPVDAANRRYAIEFVGRAVYATYPAAVLLAARGAAWGWRSHIVTRAMVLGLGVAAFGLGTHEWLAWLT